MPGGGFKIILLVFKFIGVTPGGGLNIILLFCRLADGINNFGTPIDGSRTSKTSRFRETPDDNCALDRFV